MPFKVALFFLPAKGNCAMFSVSAADEKCETDYKVAIS